MGINKYYTESQNDFVIYGEKNEDWENYIKGEDYDSFLVKLK
jgi:hypothetical protein